MNSDTTSNIITLDWDDIPYYEAISRCRKIYNHTFTRQIELYRSPTKGFHCIVHFCIDVPVFQYRSDFQDDAERLANDLCNRPDYIHDVLWNTKVVDGVPFNSKHIITVKK